MKKLIVAICVLLMLVSMTACGAADDGKYVIGVCQLLKHPALDLATQGFKDALIAEIGEENLTFKDQDAGGEFTNCGTIMDGFVAENVDLILANATGPLTAAASATSTIPVLGTSITDYATALSIENWTGTVGGNISGTTDLAPMDQQAAMVHELFPEAKTVGLLYCSSEPNSVYQVNVVKAELEKLGYTAELFAFNDANDLATVTQAACDASDVIYVPTDNIAAAYPETIANVVIPAKKPVVTGESNTCASCGVASLSIDYYELGKITGQMAAKILKGEADISTMAVEPAPNVVKTYNADICQQLGITPPEGYTPIDTAE